MKDENYHSSFYPETGSDCGPFTGQSNLSVVHKPENGGDPDRVKTSACREGPPGTERGCPAAGNKGKSINIDILVYSVFCAPVLYL
ncbi:hypothetical protein MHYP_G00339220 [Metynnis hypsauchen]